MNLKNLKGGRESVRRKGEERDVVGEHEKERGHWNVENW